MVEPSVLDWSVAALGEATERLTRWGVWDKTRAYEAISDAVWRVTILDAALVRHRPSAYDKALGMVDTAERASIEQTLAGLRLVRNRIGDSSDLAEFVDATAADSAPVTGRITGWRWMSVPEPQPGSGSQASRAWELARYQAYQNRLVGTAIGDAFARSEQFLVPVAGGAVSAAAREHSPTTR
jgi:hypothetical protein